MGDGPEIPAIRAFSACWTAQTGTHPPAQPPIHPRAKSRNPLSRPALRGGVARPGTLAIPGFYPAPKSTPRFSLAQAPYPSFPPQVAKTCSFRCASSPAHDRCAGPWAGFRHTAETRRSLACGYTDASPASKRPHGGPQTVTRGFPAPAGGWTPADALRTVPTLPAGGRNTGRSPHGDGA